MAKAALASTKQVYWVKKLAQEKPLTEEQNKLVADNFTEGMTAKTASWLLDMLFAIEVPVADLVPGLYEHNGQAYLVKVGGKSGKPYAMALSAEFAPEGKVWDLSYEQGKGVAATLATDERLAIDIPEKDLKFAKASVLGDLYEAWQVDALLGAV
jgi:hypothetical protein